MAVGLAVGVLGVGEAAGCVVVSVGVGVRLAVGVGATTTIRTQNGAEAEGPIPNATPFGLRSFQLPW